MNLKLGKHIYSIFFSLILIFSMNFRGYAGYVDYLDKMEKNCIEAELSQDDEDESNNYYSNTNSSEENETQGSNMFEILEKLNTEVKYSFSFSDLYQKSNKQEFFHLDLYSLLKVSLSTPPPEFI
ncbi:MAG TPA: hypothetical protein VIG94_00990 [Faecalibacter sp.]